MEQRRNIIFYFFLSLVFMAVSYLFYASPMRDKVEDYFYDMRVRLQPATIRVPNITLVTIDEASIDYLEGEQAEDISANSMLKLVEQIQKSASKEIVVLYFSNIFDYQSAETKRLVDLMQKDERLTLGTLGMNFKNPFFLDFAETLEPVSKRVLGIETFKDRSTNIVRDMPYYGYRGINRSPLLPLYLAKKLNNEPEPQSTHYRLNYLRPRQFAEIKAEDALNLLEANQAFKDQIVIIGYNIYRKWPAQTLDPMLVNTPFEGSPDTFAEGEPIIYLAATSVDNIVNRRALEPAPLWLNILQVILMTLLFSLAWRLGPIVGSLVTVILFAMVALIHAVIFEYGAILLPFSDMFLFASFAIILGAVGSLSVEIQRYGDIRAKVKADHELDRLQSRFLDQFAQGVSRLNQQLLVDSRHLSNVDDLGSSERKLVEACIDSCIEFEDFLSGIKQLASTSGDNRLTNPTQTEFLLVDLIAKILMRFEQQNRSKDIHIKVELPPDLKVVTSYEILDTIIYNLISNAIKYSPKSSEVEIRGAMEGSKVRLSVIDRGPGIPKELQTRVFEKFYRVKDDNVYRIKGTGIGLYLTKFFAEKIGASIGLVSQPGVGSTFYVEIG